MQQPITPDRPVAELSFIIKAQGPSMIGQFINISSIRVTITKNNNGLYLRRRKQYDNPKYEGQAYKENLQGLNFAYVILIVVALKAL